MAEAQTLLALADRCEREEPSDELWHHMARTLGWRWELDGRITYWFTPEGDIWNLPDWLRSIDAAVTLVPDEHEWAIYSDGCGWFTGELGPKRTLKVYKVQTLNKPASAICAASLRARAALAKDPT